MLQPLPSLLCHLIWSHPHASHRSVFSLMDQPFFVLAVSFTLCMAGLFSFLWPFPKRPSLPSPEVCGLEEKEQPP